MSLTGCLLVASPTLFDPNFVSTVVLVIHHGDPGAVGVVCNRPTTLSPERLPPGWPVTDPVHAGGPVEPEVAIAVAETDGDHHSWERIGARLWLADLDGPPTPVQRLRIFAGYAGWGPGQLEDEVSRGDWIVADATAEDVFTADASGLWRLVLRRQPDPIRLLAGYPTDPSLN